MKGPSQWCVPAQIPWTGVGSLQKHPFPSGLPIRELKRPRSLLLLNNESDIHEVVLEVCLSPSCGLGGRSPIIIVGDSSYFCPNFLSLDQPHNHKLYLCGHSVFLGWWNKDNWSINLLMFSWHPQEGNWYFCGPVCQSSFVAVSFVLRTAMPPPPPPITDSHS